MSWLSRVIKAARATDFRMADYWQPVASVVVEDFVPVENPIEVVTGQLDHASAPDVPFAPTMAAEDEEPEESGETDVASQPESLVETVQEPKEPEVDWEARLRQEWQHGFTEGYESASEELRTLWEKRLEELAASWQGAIETVETELVDLAMYAAERVIRKQLDLEPDSILEVVRDLLRQVGFYRQLELRLHPTEAGVVAGWRHELELALDGRSDLEVIPDPSIHRGGVWIESDGNSFDARIETQLEQIGEALREEVGDNAATTRPA